MNKLVLIGNGFDRAHGLPTSYKDFLNSFWRELRNNYDDELVRDIVLFNERGLKVFENNIEIKSFDDFWNNITKVKWGYLNSRNYELLTSSTGGKEVFKFKNEFFKRITLKQSLENWVDIENEYYMQLKKIVKQTPKNVRGRFETNEELSSRKKKEVIKLNEDFKAVKKLLEKYLSLEVEKTYNFNEKQNVKEWFKVSQILKPHSVRKEHYLSERLKELSNEFSSTEDRNMITNYVNMTRNITSSSPIYFESLLLSFNYTSCTSQYQFDINRDIGKDRIKSNYIHGSIGNTKNPINFGFGDEIDQDYDEIENIGDNEYLKNFKSFQYSNTNNYNELLRYIDSNKFQVYILGHSCGLSDRILLNTIFEHDNCRSIKIYYYQKDGGTDNYTDIVQNVSRHFKDKALMRRKLVNKTLCSPLPQTVRFKRVDG